MYYRQQDKGNKVHVSNSNNTGFLWKVFYRRKPGLDFLFARDFLGWSVVCITLNQEPSWFKEEPSE